MINEFLFSIDETIQRVAQNLPSSMFNTLAQATNTPHYPHSQNTPYTPSGQTVSVKYLFRMFK